MSDLSTLTPVKKPPFVPGTFRARRPEVVRYTREFPYGRVYLPGGGRTISEYGRSYPLPEALTEIRRSKQHEGVLHRTSKGVRLPTRQIRRLSGNPNGDLKTWLMTHWKPIAIGVGAVVFLGLVCR